MTDTTIERLAREAGLIEDGWHSVPAEKLPALAALVAEECAKECDALPILGDGDTAALWYSKAQEDCARAIRAKFPQPSRTSAVGDKER